MTPVPPPGLPRQSSGATQGFTLLESIIILAIVGILAAIVAPTWKTLLDRQRVNTAQRVILASFREAQYNAQRDLRDWQVCFRTQNGQVQTLIHAQTLTDPVGCPGNDPRWRPLAGEVSHEIQITHATLPLRNGYRSSRFLANGRVSGAGASGGGLGTGRIVIAPKNQTAPRRCVFISTILGTARTARNAQCD
ncbi:pilus assembly FimT family protein [Trichothermofontia sp.]